MVDVPDANAPFRKLIDSTTMLTIARFAWPVVIGLLGYLGAMQLSDLKAGQRDGLAELKDGQRQVWTQVSKIAEAQATTNSIQSGLSVKVDSAVKQLDHLQAQVDSLPRK